MPVLAVVALGVVVLSGASSGSAGPGSTARTTLTVTYRENGPASAPTRWTLRCNPARGTLPRPAIACRRLAAGGPKLFAPVPPNAVCTEIYGGPQAALVTGVVAGTRVWTRFTRENGCQIARWSRVSPWLLPRGGVG